MAEAATVYVVPSTWIGHERIRSRSVHMPEPYERVVGMKALSGNRLWVSPTHTGDHAAAYNPADAEEKVIPLGATYVRRLAAIFEQFMCYGTQTAPTLNCDRFVRLMTGQVWPGSKVAKQEAERLVATGVIADRNLGLGERGDFGGKGEDGTSFQHHTVFGLGEERDDCLQVMAAGGHMGIATYGSMNRFYAERYSMLADYGMYVVQAAGVPPLNAA